LGVSARNVLEQTFGEGMEAVSLPRQARAGVAVSVPPRGTLEQLTLALDVDLAAVTVGGRRERRLAGGAEAWVWKRRVGLRGGLGANLAEDGDAIVSGGASVAVWRGIYVEAVATGGSDSARDSWGVGLRATF
jgi:hypothetical protein